MPPSSLDLPDINVWLALINENHAHHQRARAYWETGNWEKIAFCRVTMLGLMRLATNTHVMAGHPFLPSEIWDAYRRLTALPEVIFLQEPKGLEKTLETCTHPKEFHPGHWTDAYLAAFALESNCRIVSFDGDFKAFKNLSFLHLKIASY
jgi:uncharacterized protein